MAKTRKPKKIPKVKTVTIKIPTAKQLARSFVNTRAGKGR